MAPVGYLIAESVSFEVLETYEVQKIVMKDERKAENPKTGDNIYLLYILSGVFLLTAINIVFFIIKIKKTKRGN